MNQKVKWRVLYQTYTFTRNISFLTCQILSLGSLVLQKKLKVYYVIHGLLHQ